MTRALIVAGLQVLLILGWAGSNEWTRQTAPRFRVPLDPADPYDILRGRYFILNPQDSNLSIGHESRFLTPQQLDAFTSAAGNRGSFRGAALVGFCPENELERVCALVPEDSDTLPPGPGFWSRGQVTAQRKADHWRVQIDLGLDQFFLPNRALLPAREQDPGWSLEVAHRPGLSPLPIRLWYQDRPVVF